MTGEHLANRLKEAIHVYSSTMTRARQTTEHLLTKINNTVHVKYIDIYREFGFADVINPIFPEADLFSVSPI